MSTQDRDMLLAEHRFLASQIDVRGSQTLGVQSILISTSLAVATFAISQRQQLGFGVLLQLPLVSTIIFLDLVLPLIALIFQLTSTQLDRIAQRRLGEIEVQLGIPSLRDQFRGKWWHHLRIWIWPLSFLFLMTVYAGAALRFAGMI